MGAGTNREMQRSQLAPLQGGGPQVQQRQEAGAAHLYRYMSLTTPHFRLQPLQSNSGPQTSTTSLPSRTNSGVPHCWVHQIVSLPDLSITSDVACRLLLSWISRASSWSALVSYVNPVCLFPVPFLTGTCMFTLPSRKIKLSCSQAVFALSLGD